MQTQRERTCLRLTPSDRSGETPACNRSTLREQKATALTRLPIFPHTRALVGSTRRICRRCRRCRRHRRLGRRTGARRGRGCGGGVELAGQLGHRHVLQTGARKRGRLGGGRSRRLGNRRLRRRQRGRFGDGRLLGGRQRLGPANTSQIFDKQRHKRAHVGAAGASGMAGPTGGALLSWSVTASITCVTRLQK